MQPATLLALDNVTLRVRDRWILPRTSWQIREGEQWAVIGPNGAGKTSLMRALLGRLSVVQGRLRRHPSLKRPGAVAWVSLEQEQAMIAREEGRDEARCYAGRMHAVATAGDILCLNPGDGDDSLPLSLGEEEALGTASLLVRPLRSLSTGEMRRLLIARALVQQPRLLILDEPFDGLDHSARKHLGLVLGRLVRQGLQIVLIVHRPEDLIDEVTHVLALKDCRVCFQGPRAAVLTTAQLDKLYRVKHGQEGASAALPLPRAKTWMPSGAPKDREVVIEFRRVTVFYGRLTVFQDLDWCVRRGEHWCILGPNGAGKSTLLSLIMGDHPQAYSNDIRLFGRRRGSGESIWEIKKRIGSVSADLQIHYRRPLRVRDVVLSGFHDSVGLYRHVTPEQRAAAQAWMDRLAIREQDEIFDRLSYGQRRLVLMARALVKPPEILILDEPCQGLDPSRRRRVLELIDHLVSLGNTQVLHVTHQQRDIPRCITHILHLRQGRFRIANRVKKELDSQRPFTDTSPRG